MTTIRRFTCNDLFGFNNVNLDWYTETYNLPFYLFYLARWPEYFLLAEGPGKQTMGYIMGKVEGDGELWHGHVTAVTVAPEYRRQQLARKLMNLLEEISEKTYNTYFVDLFVRVSNTPAINMYKKFGYTIYRRVLSYYSGEEDAFDMRRACPRDKDKKSVIPLGRDVHPDELEHD
eukprot:TRINITY_DN3329_c1_g1_i1.p1 TRINITY_DN3329_c1_g1~~TRINITY_DN3329_c1_g1_i1.p1  ORF type:complete len:175 (-),score=33.64 TRINITY_DN3329_c1_g1_i1:10-534(-)